MSMSISVTSEIGAIERRFGEEAAKENQIKMAMQVGEDSNFYCRVLTGATRDSMANSSNYAEGDVSWTTPYANDIYYHGNPSTRINPNASLQWFEVAKRQRLQSTWVPLVRSMYA